MTATTLTHIILLDSFTLDNLANTIEYSATN